MHVCKGDSFADPSLHDFVLANRTCATLREPLINARHVESVQTWQQAKLFAILERLFANAALLWVAAGASTTASSNPAVRSSSVLHCACGSSNFCSIGTLHSEASAVIGGTHLQNPP